MYQAWKLWIVQTSNPYRLQSIRNRIIGPLVFGNSPEGNSNERIDEVTTLDELDILLAYHNPMQLYRNDLISYAFFKEELEPVCEEMVGGRLYCIRKNMNRSLLQEYWKKLLTYVMAEGESFPEKICGAKVRRINQWSNLKDVNVFTFEVWTKYPIQEVDIVSRLNIIECILPPLDEMDDACSAGYELLGSRFSYFESICG